jgi:hypothetical protein
MVLVLQRARDGLWPVLLRLMPARRDSRPPPEGEPLARRSMPAAGTVPVAPQETHGASATLQTSHAPAIFVNVRIVDSSFVQGSPVQTEPAPAEEVITACGDRA